MPLTARRLTPLLFLAGASIFAANCRQATGLDEFRFLQCTPGAEDCLLPPEDCVAGVDTNGDSIPPDECTGEIAWVNRTAGDNERECPGGLTNFTIMPTRHLSAIQSFGDWAGSLGTVRGSLGPCEQDACAIESFAHDPSGQGRLFLPQVPCEDTLFLQALARGKDHAHAASASGSTVVVSSHRVQDGSFASRWSWTAPEAITSLDIAAGTAPVVAVGLSDRVLFVAPDPSFPSATFHELPGAKVSSIALSKTTLLLAGQTVAPSQDPGPCGLAAKTATAFVARATLQEGSTNASSPTKLTCDGFALKLDIGKDTESPSMRVAAGTGSRACWAYLGTNGSTNERTLRTGCFDTEDPKFDWQQKGSLGDLTTGEVDIAMDAFGNVIVTAAIQRSTPLPWDGTTIALVANGIPNIVLLKLSGKTGDLVWARMFASPGGNAREPRVTADDDGLVRLGVVTDGAPLAGNGLQGLAGEAGYAVHFVGVRP